jgi:hypothetical protein
MVCDTFRALEQGTSTMGTEHFRIWNFHGNHTVSSIISVYVSNLTQTGKNRNAIGLENI